MVGTRTLNIISLALVVIGGINWGFVALFGFDPLMPILGGYDSILAKLVYGAVGLASLWVIYAYLTTPGEDIERTR